MGEIRDLAKALNPSSARRTSPKLRPNASSGGWIQELPWNLSLVGRSPSSLLSKKMPLSPGVWPT
jgi:hypothetical protein